MKALVLFLLFISNPSLAGEQATDRATYHPEVLHELIEITEAATSSELKPVVVFDIDDTLIDTRFRTQKILKELVREEFFGEEFPAEAEMLHNIRSSQIHYDIIDTLQWMKLTDDRVTKLIKNYWAEKFFTNAYVSQDRPFLDAVEYVSRLHAEGARIVYLTGRDAPRMQEGTRYNLIQNGFPMDTNTELMMKPGKEIPDLDYKKAAFTEISKMGEVIGAFENEPANVNAFKQAWPNATMVFIDSIHSNKPDVPEKDIAWIKNYRY